MLPCVISLVKIFLKIKVCAVKETLSGCLHDLFFCAGMHYLHAEAPLKVIHRDLKSRNGELPAVMWLMLQNNIVRKGKYFLNLLTTVSCFSNSCVSCRQCIKGSDPLFFQKQFLLWPYDKCNSDYVTNVLSVTDLWFWGIKVGFSHHTYVPGGHLPLDGPRSDPEFTRLRNLWHILIRRGQYLCVNIYVNSFWKSSMRNKTTKLLV